MLTNILIAGTVVVCPDCDVRGLKQAVSIAQPYDTILIKEGHYKEDSIIVDKPGLVIMGEGEAVIDANQKWEAILVIADSVTVTGLTIMNVPVSYIHDHAALKFDGVSGCQIINNTFINNFFAIYLAHSEGCLVKDNYIKSNAKREMAAGNGIHAWYCHDLYITGNTVIQHRDGIYFEFVDNSFIEGNYSTKNLRYGLHFMFSDRDVYSHNTFVNNGAGTAVMYSRLISLYNNIFEKNWGGASYGILLKEIYDCKIYNNIFRENTVGLYMENCNRTPIEHNDFIGNGWALRVMANSQDNLVSMNNFIDNMFEVATNSRRSFNKFNKNYWSKYNGYDLDRDGIGDIPYRPVSLTSYLIENYEAISLMIESYFLKLLDLLEKIAPSINPVGLVDREPLMERVKHD